MKKLTYSLLSMLLIAACSAPTKEKAAEETVATPVGDVQYSTDSTNMKGYFALDQSNTTKRPGILVVHEWWGHNDYARERADMLADLGYVAFAMDMYGEGKIAEHPDDAGKFTQEVMSNIDEAKARFESALNTLKAHPNVDPEKIGAIGYCFGGSVVLSMANAGFDLDAVAAFHAGLGLPIQPETGAVKTRVLVANGADDPFIPEQQVEDFKRVMDAAGVDYKYIAYPGAVHSFTSKYADEMGAKFNMPLAYQPEADSASWAEMQALFKATF
ncbi:MAG: dienelactone hydrolase family protein [Cyclobacteriaceae bacterium]